MTFLTQVWFHCNEFCNKTVIKIKGQNSPGKETGGSRVRRRRQCEVSYGARHWRVKGTRSKELGWGQSGLWGSKLWEMRMMTYGRRGKSECRGLKSRSWCWLLSIYFVRPLACPAFLFMEKRGHASNLSQPHHYTLERRQILLKRKIGAPCSEVESPFLTRLGELTIEHVPLYLKQTNTKMLGK